jgi:glucan phosphoethanolaminetransferase (alkaline phosphatase superfamily)
MSAQSVVEGIWNRLLYRSHPFVMVNGFAAVLFFLIRVFELVSVIHAVPEDASLGYLIVMALVNDLLFFGCAMFVLTLLYFLIAKVANDGVALRVHLALLLFLVFLSLGVSKYFTVTLLPLSSDFYGYSLGDIRETVSASGGISPFLFIVFALIGVIVFYLPALALRFPSPKFIMKGFYGLCVLSFPLLFVFEPSPEDFGKELEYNIAENKALHFTRESMQFFSRKIFGGSGYSDKEYPFQRTADYSDVLGNFMNVQREKPNIVIIIVEGLGSSFVNGGNHQGFTPFFDSLSRQSLNWKNFLSTSGRTFGVLPSLTASLPFSEKGFMELASDMPDHRSLFTLLEQNGYRSSFYYGGRINFDKMNIFLERQQIRNIIDEGDFLPPYEKSPPTEAGFSWGYAYDDLFKRSLQDINEANFVPRLDVYLTLSTHEPFKPPHWELYQQLFEQMLDTMDMSVEKRTQYGQFKEIYSALLYTDDALRHFIEAYKKRSDFNNTIFVITGDHRLIPVPADTKIDRYRVPFVIYSPMLKHPAEILSVSSHADFVPTILGFLKQNYTMNLPKESHWIGTLMDTVREFRNNRAQAFMPFKGEISDYLDGKYFLSGGRLFEVFKGLKINEIQNDSIRKILDTKRSAFVSLCNYVCLSNKIYPSENLKRFTAASTNDDSLFAAIDRMEKNSDQLFIAARDTAFKGFHEESRGICRRLLAINPDYHDVRTLMGRTFAWDHRYADATEAFTEVIRRSPNYSDAYFGLAQVDYWSGNPDAALKHATHAVDLLPENIYARVLKAKLLFEKGENADAGREVNEILKRSPQLAEAKALEQKIAGAIKRR